MSNIAEIDNLIARCHYCDDLEVAKSIQADAISVFKKLGCSNEIIQSCCNLDFGENTELLKIPMGDYGYCESPINQIRAFNSDLKEMREILNEARIIIERKNNQKIQHWSLILAAIAAVGTIITLLFTIFDYLCNN